MKTDSIELEEWGKSDPITGLSQADIQALERFEAQSQCLSIRQSSKGVVLKARGYVGQCLFHLPDYGPLPVAIHTKVPVFRLLEWWCCAENVPVEITELVELNEAEDILDLLACWLATRIMRLAQQGLLSSYQRQTESLSSPKGRILIRPSVLALAIGQSRLTCSYDHRTQDNPENRLLLWTLHCLRQRGLRHEQTQHLVLQASRRLQPVISLTPFRVNDCDAIRYTRLNQHYEPMHNICRMILSQISIDQHLGQKTVPSFMLNMHEVFEKAVARMLSEQLKGDFHIVVQKPVELNALPPMNAWIDLVAHERVTHKPLLVLDTKYKKFDGTPSHSDFYQIISYALSQNVTEGWLLYPHEISQASSCEVGGISCRTLSVPMTRSPWAALGAVTSSINNLRRNLLSLPVRD